MFGASLGLRFIFGTDVFSRFPFCTHNINEAQAVTGLALRVLGSFLLLANQVLSAVICRWVLERNLETVRGEYQLRLTVRFNKFQPLGAVCRTMLHSIVEFDSICFIPPMVESLQQVMRNQWHIR